MALKKTTIIWDFDGTIMDTTDVVLASWQHTYKTLENREEDPEVIYRTFGEPLPLSMEKVFPNVPVEESVGIYRSYHHHNYGGSIKVFDGVKETLDALLESGFRMALVTSRAPGTTMEGLEAFGINKYFEQIVTSDDTDKHKPDPEPANIALRKMGVTAGECLMIGDTFFDLGCSANAGIDSVLVGWSVAVGKDDKLGLFSPTYIIDKPEDLLCLLGKLNEE